MWEGPGGVALSKGVWPCRRRCGLVEGGVLVAMSSEVSVAHARPGLFLSPFLSAAYGRFSYFSAPKLSAMMSWSHPLVL